MSDSIEVFQDLSIHVPRSSFSSLRSELISAAAAPWKFDLKRSDELKKSSMSNADVLLFRRDAIVDHPAVNLSLWQRGDTYYVPNIVPESGSLNHSEYNAVLGDFVIKVVRPVSTKLKIEIELSSARKSLTDWLTEDAARKLHVFSVSANKSSGASHPLDRQRWLNFVIAAHRADSSLNASTLARWLHEIEGWDEESAHVLAGEFENFIELLTLYDNH